ncbi:MAG: virulence RhuM family protein [Acholeplasmatales bacterium]|nr:virulence RhuM family protein [Acholeplasmatales bacterium]
MNIQEKKYELIKFEDGEFSLDVNVSPDEETVWLSAQEMAYMFERDYKTIQKHINNVFFEKELDKISNSQKVRLTGNDKPTQYYSLNVIISVGYRVKSQRGTQFRIWANSVLKQYLLNGYSINNKRCVECQENIITLNNKVNNLIENTSNMNNRLLSLESTDKILSNMLFYENNIFEAYSYIKKLLLSAKKEIIIIDGYIDITVLDMLNEINIPITIYTLPSASITKQDISKFQINHNLTVIRTNIIHDRFLIIDNEIYSIGSSIKDVGKKRFVMTKIITISKDDLLKNI